MDPSQLKLCFLSVLAACASTNAAQFQCDATGNLIAVLPTTNAAPGLAAQQPSVFAGTDEPLTLSANIQSGWPASLQWFRNGVLVAGATNESFLLPNPGLSDSGLYSVVVSNAYGVVTGAVAQVSLHPAYEQFDSPRDLVFTGAANLTNLQVQLSRRGQPGSAWLAQEQFCRSGFASQFQFQMGPDAGYGQDTFSFELQTSGTNVVEGMPGPALRLVWHSQTLSTPNWYVTVEEAGTTLATASLSALGLSVLEPSPREAVHTAEVRHDGLSLDLRVDGLLLFNHIPVPLDPALDAQGMAWVGFGANAITNAPGAVLSWTFEPTPATAGLQVLVNPASQAVTPGANASMTVLAGSGTYSYQWQFNGTNLPAGTNATLTVANVQVAQMGAYFVVVSNAAGEVGRVTNGLAVLLPIAPPFNTGLSNRTTLSPPGTPDPHWQLLPGSQVTGNPVLYPAQTFPPLTNGLCYWIGPVSYLGHGPSVFLFQTWFWLDPGQVETALLQGTWATVGAGADILINGHSTGQTIGDEISTFTNSPFVIHNGFVAGSNSVTFVVSNSWGTYDIGLCVVWSSATSLIYSNEFNGDSDQDGLPDAWELATFGNLWQSGSDDFDGDGVSNLDELLEGTDPLDPNSFRPRLTLSGPYWQVARDPDAPSYARGSQVTLTAMPQPGEVFDKWTGSLAGSQNPITFTISNHMNVQPKFIQLAQGGPVFVPGLVVHEKFNNVSDGAGYPVANLFTNAQYPLQPDVWGLETAFEYPPGLSRDPVADPLRDYFDLLEGFFVPPLSTNYVFFMSFDDRAAVWLSTDEDPANRHKIAEQSGGWTDPRSWTVGHSTDMTQARSDLFWGTEWPAGHTISLQAGQKYYLLIAHHDPSWAGNDWFGLTYKVQGEPDPAVGSLSRLSGQAVGTYLNAIVTAINFSQPPTNTTALQGQAATFTALATASPDPGLTVPYQWQSAPPGSSIFTNIPYAAAQSFTTPALALADSGRQFRVVGILGSISSTSSVATLTVLPNTLPPGVAVGAMLDPITGNVEVGVGFDQPVDDASWSALANYTISSGAIASLGWFSNRFTADSQNPLVMTRKQNALLKLTGFAGGSGTLTISNAKNAYGNAITPITLPFTVDIVRKWGVVGANEFGGWNAAVPVGPGAWDIYSDGVAEWASYDETTFVYEPVTGDFDKQLRVQYQDGSSTWARAGLIVRDVLNFGVNRATQQGGAAGRYQKCHADPVGPVLTGPGNAGYAGWEGNRRLDQGGATTTALSSNNAAPLYPSAWCRLKRTGQTFTLYRSDDGVNWLELGATTWGVNDATKTPMPNTVYVGPEFSPENGDITLSQDRGTFLAQFRDYGDYPPAFNPQMSILVNPVGGTAISWTLGSLVSAPSVQGPYTPVTGAVSPYVVTPTAAAAFYRVRQ